MVALALISLATAAAGQRAPELSIRGVVVGALDARPVPGVTVTLIQRVATGQKILNESIVTESNGAFVLHAPAAGEYDLSASRSPYGFGLYGRDAFTSTPQKWFTVAGPTAGIVIRLWEGPRVTGVVRDEHGEPMAGALVRPLERTTIGGQDVLAVRGGYQRTDAAGRYSLQFRAPGQYVISASAWPSASQQPTARQYYPGVSTPGAATIVELKPSRTASGIDFTLVREPGFVVSGVVEGSEAWDGTVLLELHESGVAPPLTNLPVDTTALAGGRFTFRPVPAGSYVIRFARYPRSGQGLTTPGAPSPVSSAQNEATGAAMTVTTWWAVESVKVEDSDVQLRVEPRQGVRVGGRVILDGGDPKQPISIAGGIQLRGTDYPPFPSVPAAPVGTDGSFRTIPVPPGRYAVGAGGIEGYQLESVTVAGRESAGLAFDLLGDVHDAVLRFSRRETVVTGRVLGDDGEERFVVIWPEDDRLMSASGTGFGRTYRAITVDGLYRIPVLPGTYRVAARGGPLPQHWESPDFLSALLPLSQRVLVGPGQTVVHNPIRD